MTDGSEQPPAAPVPVTACTIGSDEFCQDIGGECEICGRSIDEVNE